MITFVATIPSKDTYVTDSGETRTKTYLMDITVKADNERQVRAKLRGVLNVSKLPAGVRVKPKYENKR